LNRCRWQCPARAGLARAGRGRENPHHIAGISVHKQGQTAHILFVPPDLAVPFKIQFTLFHFQLL
jgi:hypothetical protein